MLVGLHLAYTTDGDSLCNLYLGYAAMPVWENAKLPSSLPDYNWSPFQSSRDYYSISFIRPTLPLPWLDTIHPGIFLTFGIICAASTQGHMQMLPTYLQPVLVSHETWPLTSVSFNVWSCLYVHLILLLIYFVMTLTTFGLAFFYEKTVVFCMIPHSCLLCCNTISFLANPEVITLYICGCMSIYVDSFHIT